MSPMYILFLENNTRFRATGGVNISTLYHQDGNSNFKILAGRILQNGYISDSTIDARSFRHIVYQNIPFRFRCPISNYKFEQTQTDDLLTISNRLASVSQYQLEGKCY